MCGVLGIITNFPLQKSYLDKMNSVLSHRGPSGNGEEIVRMDSEYYLHLIHKRLSILDLSEKGSQPMVDPESGCIILYNGELYNYKELRKTLAADFIFNSRTDTEVVLKSYLKWGKNCLNNFNGMFAFIIWDPREQVLFVARDRFGEKPLFFAHANFQKSMIISSELKAILAFPGFSPILNYEVLEKYLREGKSVTSGHQTPFKNIHQLCPSSWMRISNQGEILEVQKYWSPTFKEQHQDKKEDELILEFSDLLEKSVLTRVDCDVQVGACLSGGLDSTSIVGFLARNKPSNFNSTISVRFDNDPTISEGSYLDTAVSAFQGNHLMITPDPLDLLADIESIHWHHEIPLPSSSMFLEWSVMKRAKEAGNIVMIDGQGSDELLGGYPYYFQHYQRQMLSTKKYSELLKNSYLFRHYLRKESKKHDEPERRIPMNSSLSEIQLIALFVKQLIRTFIPLNKKGFSSDEGFDPNMHFSNLIQSGLSNTSLQEQLLSADRNGMAFGIETRFPFLDYKFVDFCLGLPINLLIKRGMQKYILRQAVKDVIPEKIFNRKDKIGFLSPQDKWLKNELKDWTFSKIFEGPVKSLSFYNLSEIKKTFDEFHNKEFSIDSSIIWRYSSLSQWLETFGFSNG